MTDKKLSGARLLGISKQVLHIGNYIAIAGILVTIAFGYFELQRIDRNADINAAEIVKDNYFSAKIAYLRSVH